VDNVVNVAELDALVGRLRDTFPNGPHASVWKEALADREHAYCHRAYLRLRDTHTSATLTIAAFLTCFLEVRNEALSASRRAEPLCAHCGGEGWVTAPELVVGSPPRLRHYRQAKPCPYCEAGRRAQPVHARIEANRPHATRPEPLF
jgi:hypothetical protein